MRIHEGNVGKTHIHTLPGIIVWLTATGLFARRFLALVDGAVNSLDVAVISRPSLGIDTGRRGAMLERYGLTMKRFVKFAPGEEYGAAKQLADGAFGELGGKFVEQGWQVVIAGFANERILVREIKELCGSGDIIDLCVAPVFPMSSTRSRPVPAWWPMIQD